MCLNLYLQFLIKIPSPFSNEAQKQKINHNFISLRSAPIQKFWLSNRLTSETENEAQSEKGQKKRNEQTKTVSRLKMLRVNFISLHVFLSSSYLV